MQDKRLPTMLDAKRPNKHILKRKSIQKAHKAIFKFLDELKILYFCT